jgi:D-erythronate 2-dehydrogenase
LPTDLTAHTRYAMKVLVTGANGFVGQVLVERLLSEGLNGHAITSLTLVDIDFEARLSDARVLSIKGNMTEPLVIEKMFSNKPQAVFHLASMPGGAAEKNYELGRQINLDATIALLDACRALPLPPLFVFASTVAVYGESLPAVVTDQTLPAPVISYGAHKLISEYLIADATRKGWVNGCSLRLPGVVARPGSGAGLMSAFMSQVFWKLSANQSIVMPVSASGTAWWISAKTCVRNLLHVAQVKADQFHQSRTYAMPALHLPMKAVVNAIADRFGQERHNLVTWRPEPLIERLFANYPPLRTDAADALGFIHDGDAHQLVENALS